MAELEPVVTPQGAGLAFDQAVSRLAAQLQDIADLDTKIGVAIAALGVVVGAFVAQKLPAVLQALFSAWLAVGLIQAIRAFLVGSYEVAPEPRRLAENYANQPPDEMMWTALPAVLDAIDANQPKLFEKGARLNQLMVTIGLVVGLALLAKAFGLFYRGYSLRYAYQPRRQAGRASAETAGARPSAKACCAPSDRSGFDRLDWERRPRTRQEGITRLNPSTTRDGFGRLF